MAEGDHPRALSRCRSLHLLYHTTTGTPLYHTYHTSTTPDSLAGRGPGLRAVVAVEVSDQASVSLDECFLGNTTGSLRWRAEWVRPRPLRLPPQPLLPDRLRAHRHKWLCTLHSRPAA